MSLQVLVGDRWQDIHVLKMVVKQHKTYLYTDEGKTLIVDSCKVRDTEKDHEARSH